MKNFRAGFGVFFVEKRIFEKDNRNLLKIGVNFSAETRNIEKWIVEKPKIRKQSQWQSQLQ